MTFSQIQNDLNYLVVVLALAGFSLIGVLFHLAGIMQRVCLLLADLSESTNRSRLPKKAISSSDNGVEYPCCETSCSGTDDLGGFCETCSRRALLPSEHPASLKYISVPPEEALLPVCVADQKDHAIGNAGRPSTSSGEVAV